MKITVGLLLSFVYGAAASTCSPANVYMFKGSRGHHIAKDSPILDIDQTQLVLSDVSGTSRFHSVSNAEDARIVNSLSMKGSLFNKSPHNSVMIVVDNVKDGELLDVKPSFKIDRSPDSGYFVDFIERTKQELSELTGKVSHTVKEGISILTHHDTVKRSVDEAALELEHDISVINSLDYNVVHDDGAFVHLKSLTTVENYNEGLAAIKDALTQLINQSSAKITIIALPEDTCAIIDIAKRDSKKKAVSAAQNVGASFKSKESCEKATNNCSGHGSCQEIHNGNFACACKSTFDDEKKKTTHWGGNACQKKDVSVEFQLFFWTGLGILAVFVYGAQLLYSIGSEPLPGVLNTAK